MHNPGESILLEPGGWGGHPPGIAGEFVYEDDRNGGADLLEKELHTIVGGEMGPSATP